MRRFFLISSLAATLGAASPARAQSAPAESSSTEDPLDVPDGKIIHTATVRLDPNPALRLEALVDGSEEWEPVCTAPCGGAKRLDAMYRIAGDDIQASAPFRLAVPSDGRVDLHVHGLSKTPHSIGLALTVGGAIGMGVGVLTVFGTALAVLGETEQCEGAGKLGQPCSPANTDGLAVGAAIGAAGLASLVAGIVLMLENQHSDVDQDVASPTPAPSTQLLLPRHGQERSTADTGWRVGAIESPRAITIPVLGATF